jgi:hypothetical protein
MSFGPITGSSACLAMANWLGLTAVTAKRCWTEAMPRGKYCDQVTDTRYVVNLFMMHLPVVLDGIVIHTGDWTLPGRLRAEPAGSLHHGRDPGERVGGR